jgi:hypothetical protein
MRMSSDAPAWRIFVAGWVIYVVVSTLTQYVGGILESDDLISIPLTGFIVAAMFVFIFRRQQRV